MKPREMMDRLAAYPPLKVNPPKDTFPGDEHADQDADYDLSYFKPWNSGGLKQPPRQRGELDGPRPPGDIGVPIQPTQPQAQGDGGPTDDSRRRKQIPPMFDPNRQSSAYRIFTKSAGWGEYSVPESEGWETEKIPTALWKEWKRAHDIKREIENKRMHLSLEDVEHFLETVARFAGRARQYIRGSIDQLADAFKRLDAKLMDPKVINSEMALYRVVVEVDAILNRVHSETSMRLQVDDGAWYNKKGGEQDGVYSIPFEPSITEVSPKSRFINGGYRVALDVAPVPKQKVKVEMHSGDPLVSRLPNDLQDRYTDLSRRILDYTRSVGGYLGALDAYKYRNAPPRDWVERELPSVTADWEDTHAWGRYISRLDHSEIAEWAGFKTADPSTISPALHTAWAVSADQHDFNKWFRTTKPPVRKDENLVVFLRDHARANPDSEHTKGFESWWKRRYMGRMYSRAYHQAKEKWRQYVEKSGTSFAREEYKEALEAVERAARGEKVPVSELLDHLRTLPFEGEYKTDLDSYHTELTGLVNEGVTALDLAAAPVSREDRLSGDFVHEGERWIPVRRIEGVEGVESCKGTKAIPVRVYRYGSRYFPVDEYDAQRVAYELERQTPYLQVDVTNVVPGSSIAKRVVGTVEDFNRKSRLLAEAIHEISGGMDREAVFVKYGRDYGPGLRRAVNDYFYVQSIQEKDADAGSIDDTAGGGGTCSQFWNGQTADNCAGCTFDVGTGGYEFGYGGCLLTHLFLNAPDVGFGRGEPASYDTEHKPWNPSLQKQSPPNYRLKDQ